jgi:hypothetical protein
MNTGDYHSYLNNPGLVRQQLIQFVCRLTRSKFERREWDSKPLVSLGDSCQFLVISFVGSNCSVYWLKLSYY